MRRILRHDKRNPAQELDLPISKNPGLNRLAELACGHAIDSADHGLSRSKAVPFDRCQARAIRRVPLEYTLRRRLKSSQSLRRWTRLHGSNSWGKAMKTVPLSEVKDDLSKFLRLAETEQIVITRHGKPAGVLIGFGSEDDWFEYRLVNDPRFL